MATLNLFTETPATFQGQDLHDTASDAQARTDSEVASFPIAAWKNAIDTHFERINNACQGLEDWGEIAKTFTCAGAVVVDQAFTATGDATFSGDLDITTGSLDVGGVATFDGNVDLNSAGPTLFIGDDSGSPSIRLGKGDAGAAIIQLYSATFQRYAMRLESDESLRFARYNGAGSFQDYPLRLEANGEVTIANNVDMQGNYLDLPTNSGAPPAVTGRMYYDTSDNITYIYNGTVWKALYA